MPEESSRFIGRIVERKHPLLSRTLWLNVATLVVAVAATLLDQQLIKDHPQLVAVLVSLQSAANIVLRFMTRFPLGITPLSTGFLKGG